MADAPLEIRELFESDFTSFLEILYLQKPKFKPEDIEKLIVSTDFDFGALEALILDYESRNYEALSEAIDRLDSYLDVVSYTQIIEQFRVFYAETSEASIKSKGLLTIAILAFGKMYVTYYFSLKNTTYTEQNAALIKGFTVKQITDLWKTDNDWIEFNCFVKQYRPAENSLSRTLLNFAERYVFPNFSYMMIAVTGFVGLTAMRKLNSA